MIDKVSTIIFLIGLLFLIVPYVVLLRKKEDLKYSQFVILTIIVVVAIVIIAFAWFLREKAKEKYDYSYALRTGRIVGGTVFASHPKKTPGLGWI